MKDEWAKKLAGIAERHARLKLMKLSSEKSTDPLSWSLPYVEIACEGIENITDFIRNCPAAETWGQIQHDIIDCFFLTLSSMIGLNAYEFSSGNLRHHQLKIISEIRELYDKNRQKYLSFLNIARTNWRLYRDRTNEKYPQFFKQILKTRGNQPFRINDFFKFEEFPDINQLEVFFGLTKDGQQETSSK